MGNFSEQSCAGVRAAILLLAFAPSVGGNFGVAEGAVAKKKSATTQSPLLHLSDAHQGREYAFRIRGVTGVDITDFKCEVSPALPDGLSLDCARLTITGTPTGTVGTTSGAIRVYDSSHDEVSLNYEIDVVNHPDEAWVGAAPVLKRRASVPAPAPSSKPVNEPVEPNAGSKPDSVASAESAGVGSKATKNAETPANVAVKQPAQRPRTKAIASAVVVKDAVLRQGETGADPALGTPAAANPPASDPGLRGTTTPSTCMVPGDIAETSAKAVLNVPVRDKENSFTGQTVPKPSANVKSAPVVVKIHDAEADADVWRTAELDTSDDKDNVVDSEGGFTIKLKDQLKAGEILFVETSGDANDSFGTGVKTAAMTCGQKVYTALAIAPVILTTELKEGVKTITGTATPSPTGTTVNIGLVQDDSYDDVDSGKDTQIVRALTQVQAKINGQVQALSDAQAQVQALGEAQKQAVSQALANAEELSDSQKQTLLQALQVSAMTAPQQQALEQALSHAQALTSTQKAMLSATIASSSLTAQQQKGLTDALEKVQMLTEDQERAISQALNEAQALSRTQMLALKLQSAQTLTSDEKQALLDVLPQAQALTDAKTQALVQTLTLAKTMMDAQTQALNDVLTQAPERARGKAVGACISQADLANLTDQMLPLSLNDSTVGYTTVNATGNFTLSLATPLIEGQRVRAVQILPADNELTGAQQALCMTKTATVKGQLDWGRVHADFIGGLLISNDSTGAATDGTTPAGNFSQAHQFYALNLEKVWALPGCYLRIPAHDRLDPSDPTKKTWTTEKCYDWNKGKLDDARRKQHLWPGVTTYFQARLTAIPVSNASTVKQDTGTPSVAAKVSAMADDPTTPAAPTDQTTANLISSAQTAKVEVGIYFPFLISRWEYEHRPNALFVAPLAKVGIDTVTGPSSTVTLNTTGTGTTTHSFEQIYNNWSYGARVGHMELGRSASKAPETYSYLDITIGPYSNLQSYICHGSDHATSLPATSTCLQPPSNPFVVSNGVDSRKRLYRLDIEGLLKIPATPLYVGLNANLGQKTLGATGLDRSYAAPDDLRFFFGTKFDIAQVLMKFVKP